MGILGALQSAMSHFSFEGDGSAGVIIRDAMGNIRFSVRLDKEAASVVLQKWEVVNATDALGYGIWRGRSKLLSGSKWRYYYRKNRFR
jgi:hypothetical protein